MYMEHMKNNDHDISVDSYIFDILDISETAVRACPVSLYTELRGIFIRTLAKEERLSLSHEDLILLYVLNLLHPKLPAYIRTKYFNQIGRERKQFCGLKTEILGDAAAFIEQKTEEKNQLMARLDSVIQENAELEMDTKIPVNPSIADEESVDEADILIKTDHVKVEYEDPETFQDEFDWCPENDETMQNETPIKLKKEDPADLVNSFDPGDTKLQHTEEKKEIRTEDLQCVHCDYVGLDSIQLKLHVATTHEDNQQRCRACDFSTTERTAMFAHQIESKHAGVIYPCDQCAYEASLLGYLMRHKEAAHSGRGNAVQKVKSQKICYECDECEFTATTVKKLKRHKEINHQMLLHQCELCDYQGTSKVNLRCHVKRMHTGGEFKCHLCDFTCTDNSYLSKHLKRHGLPKFPCDLCDYKAYDLPTMQMHKEAKHLGIRYQCEFCPASVNKLSNLHRHIKEVHGGESYQCDQCSSAFSSKNNLKMHIADKHEEHKVFCDQCSFSSATVGMLRAHIRQKHEEGTLPCDQCQYIAKSGKQLDRHKEIKHRVVTCACAHCEYVAHSGSMLEFHYKKFHPDLVASSKFEKSTKRYECDQCPYKSDIKIAFLKHIEVKHGTEKLLCDSCDFSCKLPGKMKKHKKYKHELSDSSRHPCDQCDYSATRADALKTHIKAQHEGVRYPCSNCAYKAKTKCDLKKHISVVHDRQPLTCEICQKTLNGKDNLRKHKQKQHPEQI